MPRKGTMMASCHEKPPVLKPSPNRLQNLHDPRGDQLVTVLMLDKPPSLEATASAALFWSFDNWLEQKKIPCIQEAS